MSAALLLGTLSCTKPAEDTPDPTEKASFDLLQEKILTTNCAMTGCHASESDGSFGQHKLVLASGKSYENLVNVAPANASAKTDGLLRVKPFNSLSSLFYHKLNTDAAHHGGKQYGNPMPLGRPPLSAGQIEFVRRWIEAGAPKTGSVADAALLDDQTGSNATFTPLAPPVTGQGLQLKIDPFDVKSNFERELFVRRLLNNSTDIYVKRVQIKMRPGSHHFIAYGFDRTTNLPAANQVRDLRNPDNSVNLATFLSMANHVFMAGSQSPNHDYTFPEGTALLLPANSSLDLNVHYVNKSDKVFQGEAFLNLFTVDKAEVKYAVKPINWSNESITTPPGQRRTHIKSFTFSKNVKVLALTSHMHKLGEKFVIRIKGGSRDGEVVYTTTDWEHPDIINFPTPISLKAGEGLTSEITYNNTTSKTVSFGLTSEEEMGIIFGYYYEE